MALFKARPEALRHSLHENDIDPLPEGDGDHGFPTIMEECSGDEGLEIGKRYWIPSLNDVLCHIYSMALFWP